jgi:hypothetical protein
MQVWGGRKRHVFVYTRDVVLHVMVTPADVPTGAGLNQLSMVAETLAPVFRRHLH